AETPMESNVSPAKIVALLTDFGASDPYVGVMKGVILGVCPAARIVDLCHDVPAQDILAGALMLQASYQYFPAGTVFVAVVDPGVGSARRAVAAEADRRFFVCPDNGLLSGVANRTPIARAVELTNTEYFLPRVSHTFHGRDVFAPVAAQLAAGTPLGAFGMPVADLVTIPISEAEPAPDGWEAHVLYIDRFGNAVTDLREEAMADLDPRGIRFSIGERTIEGLSRSYADVPEGEPVALVGSWGYVEISIRNGSAAEQLGLCRGDAVTARRAPSDAA
ncbi:MAG: S-adenosyl-l-methionine hydroxide adenosyltransferase family protein, partial [Armatimonadota bacterium]